MESKAQIKEIISKKEAQLSDARRESNALNTGKYKSSGNAQISKIFVQSLEKEIKDLYKELSEIENE
ncbi:hypothetical protein [Shewanella xiamenensis]|uniref:hypothetical protein n=1 Tax=Shewanella xiamenensis TaxID=332186 RepID=UPI001CC67918|nr:hypothetical protein [Shewanella xiamenensis]BDA61036.1 hypothetical protein NUITMVS1_24990 [Shewanella xiamenensis]